MKKYYTPTEKDFFIGYEYEALDDPRSPNDPNSWSQQKIESPREMEDFMHLYRTYDFMELRVPFLTREILEKEGLTANMEEYGEVEDFGNKKSSDIWPYSYYRDVNYMIKSTEANGRERLINRTKRLFFSFAYITEPYSLILTIEDDFDSTKSLRLYRGYIRCINDFRRIINNLEYKWTN